MRRILPNAITGNWKRACRVLSPSDQFTHGFAEDFGVVRTSSGTVAGDISAVLWKGAGATAVHAF